MDKMNRRKFLKLSGLVAIAPMAITKSTTSSVVTPPIIAKQIKPLKGLEEIYRIKAVEYDDYDFYEGTQQPIVTSRKRAEEFSRRLKNISKRTIEFDCSSKMLVGDIISIEGGGLDKAKYRIIQVEKLWDNNEDIKNN